MSLRRSTLSCASFLTTFSHRDQILSKEGAILNNRERLKEIILQLKQIKYDRELSTRDIYEMVKGAGFSTSESSIRRVFAPGSEDQNFRYQDTLRPVAQVLLGIYEDAAPMNPTEADALKQIALLKESMIQDLQKENEQLASRVAQLEHDLSRTVEENKRYEEQVARLRAQIDRKDDYIDRLAKKAGI